MVAAVGGADLATAATCPGGGDTVVAAAIAGGGRRRRRVPAVVTPSAAGPGGVCLADARGERRGGLGRRVPPVSPLLCDVAIAVVSLSLPPVLPLLCVVAVVVSVAVAVCRCRQCCRCRCCVSLPSVLPWLCSYSSDAVCYRKGTAISAVLASSFKLSVSYNGGISSETSDCRSLTVSYNGGISSETSDCRPLTQLSRWPRRRGWPRPNTCTFGR